MKKTMLMFLLLLVPFFLQAQTKYHDVEYNEAKGRVKSITTSTMGQSVLITFSEDGKMSTAGMTNPVYDENGYMTSCEQDMNGIKVTTTIIWENGKMKSQTIKIMDQAVTTIPIYDDKGNIIGQTINAAGQEEHVVFTDCKYDEHGNWISRKATFMGQPLEAKRTIVYYE